LRGRGQVHEVGLHLQGHRVVRARLGEGLQVDLPDFAGRQGPAPQEVGAGAGGVVGLGEGSVQEEDPAGGTAAGAEEEPSLSDFGGRVSQNQSQAVDHSEVARVGFARDGVLGERGVAQGDEGVARAKVVGVGGVDLGGEEPAPGRERSWSGRGQVLVGGLALSIDGPNCQFQFHVLLGLQPSHGADRLAGLHAQALDQHGFASPQLQRDPLLVSHALQEAAGGQVAGEDLIRRRADALQGQEDPGGRVGGVAQQHLQETLRALWQVVVVDQQPDRGRRQGLAEKSSLGQDLLGAIAHHQGSSLVDLDGRGLEADLHLGLRGQKSRARGLDLDGDGGLRARGGSLREGHLHPGGGMRPGSAQQHSAQRFLPGHVSREGHDQVGREAGGPGADHHGKVQGGLVPRQGDRGLAATGSGHAHLVARQEDGGDRGVGNRHFGSPRLVEPAGRAGLTQGDGQAGRLQSRGGRSLPRAGGFQPTGKGSGQ